MSSYRKLSLRLKILLPLVPSIFVIFLALGLYASSEIKHSLYKEMRNQMEVNVRLLSSMLKNIDTATVGGAERRSSLLIKICGGDSAVFALDTAATIRTGATDSPTLTLNGNVVNMNEALVDDLGKTFSESVATVFARKGNDFVRITTSLKKEDGTRAIGTMLGDIHPAHKRLMAGEPYHGIAKLFGNWYMTKYTPIRQGGEIIGALFVGSKINKEIEEVVNSVQQIKIGATGYVFVMDNTGGKNRGTMLIHPSKEMTGKNVTDMKDASGSMLFTNMLEKRSGIINYTWINKDAGEVSAREKTAVFTTENPWNWLIAASAYDEELYQAAVRLKWILMAAAVVCALVTAGLVDLILRSALAPLKDTSRAIERVSHGDLTVRLQVASEDEIGKIQNEINLMVGSLTEIIRQTSGTASEVSASAIQLRTTAGHMADNAENVAGQVGTVATASEEMAATSNEIAMNCHQAVNAAKRANETAKHGKAVVGNTVSAMERIAGRANQSATAVQSLGARSDQIGAIVATIEDIADQTNLLALNAAIEAARAGEMGRGFAVVADEVRALAERTTRATREIGEMIKAIQSETRESVSAMNAAVEEVGRGTADAISSGDALDDILQEISNVTLQINQIATAAEEQNATTGEITGNITRISDTVQETSQGAQETATASLQLSALSSTLQQLMGRFRV
jgi:methyl-accepting chemotaxis protein-2 (aspartate sensor receptor)